MARLCSMKSSDPVVKKNRNEFFQYLLQMMKLYAEREKVNVPKGEETEAAVKDKVDSLLKQNVLVTYFVILVLM